MGTNEEFDPVGQGTAMEPPLRLPVRASIYIDVDGTVHFGALFDELVPVADSLRGQRQTGEPSSANSRGAAEQHGASAEPVPKRRGDGP